MFVYSHYHLACHVIVGRSVCPFSSSLVLTLACPTSRTSATSTSFGDSGQNPCASARWSGMSGCLANPTPNTQVVIMIERKKSPTRGAMSFCRLRRLPFRQRSEEHLPCRNCVLVHDQELTIAGVAVFGSETRITTEEDVEVPRYQNQEGGTPSVACQTLWWWTKEVISNLYLVRNVRECGIDVRIFGATRDDSKAWLEDMEPCWRHLE